jgi:hypothetical protein
MFAMTLVLVAIGASLVYTRQQSESVSVAPQEDKTMIAEPTTRADTKPAPPLPAEDVPGKDMPDLPRYPGSVRVEYELTEQDSLVFTRVRYLSHANLDVIRGFYRGVFRAQGWKVANMEFSEGEWTFLVVHGEREANIRFEPHGRGVTRMDILLSEPLPQKQSAPKEATHNEASAASQERVPSQTLKPATPQPSRSATPQPSAPATASPSASPALTPQLALGYYYNDDGGEDWDDLGDDGGGDD